MFKYIFIVIAVAAGVYVGMNWDEISGNVDDKMDSAKEIKEQAEDVRDSVEDLLDKVK